MVRHSGRFVAYYRVSTDRQGKSGLGITGQKKAVADYLNGGPWTLGGEFVEVKSGKRTSNRPQLKAAIHACRKYKATLLIAKLDRLSRNVAFIASLLDSNVKFVPIIYEPSGASLTATLRQPLARADEVIE